jgi:hypothetical protein
MNKIIKILGFVFVLAGAILLLRFTLGGNEDTWICQDGSWVKHGNPSQPQPVVPCEKNGQSIEEVGEESNFKKVSFEESQQIAWDFAQNSSTYKFDGSGLKLDSSTALDCPYCWEFNYSFYSQYGGYGNRTGQVLSSVVTSHALKIAVKEGEVVLAVVDQSFDEISLKFVK